MDEERRIKSTFQQDVKNARHLLEIIIMEESPRYLKRAPAMLKENVDRIVDYKLRRAQISTIDEYFEV